MKKDPLKVTAVGISIVDEIRERLKKSGRGRQFWNKEKLEDERQEWITIAVRHIMNADADTGATR